MGRRKRKEVVSIGHRVTVVMHRDDAPREAVYDIVGTDRADPEADPPRIGVNCPLAQAIIGKSLGTTTAHLPRGDRLVQITSIVITPPETE